MDGHGRLLIADRRDGALRQVESGIVTTPLRDANDLAVGVALDAVGNQFFLTTSKLYRRASTGVITLLAPFGGEGVAVNAAGTAFVTAQGQCRVFKVTPDATVTAIDFVTLSGCSFKGIAVDAQDFLYITDVVAHRVWKTDEAGRAIAFAGTGTPGSSGDGGPAIDAQLLSPLGVAVGSKDSLFIAEANRIREVDKQGRISTVVGVGQQGFNGDAVAASMIMLSQPSGVAVGPRALYIADTLNNRIRWMPLAGGPKK